MASRLKGECMNKPILLVLAAGMGSRYGGLKQMDPLGPNGEIIIDYSIYDAIEAGFERFIFVIKEENKEDFDRVLLSHLPKDIEASLAFQKGDDLPQGLDIPLRKKPWGTSHAVLAARELIDAPFAVINSDDYYGKSAFKSIYNFLTEGGPDNEHAMVAFEIYNTLTDHGSVSRGVCRVEDNKLVEIVERTEVFKEADGAYFDLDGQRVHIEKKRPVSMNFWGFKESIIGLLEKDMVRFFQEEYRTNPEKAEATLPDAVGRGLDKGILQVKVLTTSDSWMGVTYREDKEKVMEGFEKLVEKGLYPKKLWD